MQFQNNQNAVERNSFHLRLANVVSLQLEQERLQKEQRTLELTRIWKKLDLSGDFSKKRHDRHLRELVLEGKEFTEKLGNCHGHGDWERGGG